MAPSRGRLTPYGNPKSGVTAFKIEADGICVQFIDRPKPYHYTYETAGRRHVEAMKKCARAGRGLATYISRNVKDRYAP